MKNIVRIEEILPVTHDVNCFRLEKPADYRFVPGQATDLSINQPGLEEETRPFTFTGLASEKYLEFTIKRYPDHHGITDRLHKLKTGGELIIREPWGAIQYKGPGYFIAGGAGITPFIAILRSLQQENKITGNRLFFSNKTAADIIYEQELLDMPGLDPVFILTKEDHAPYQRGRINEEFIRRNIKDLSRPIYICGPDAMVSELTAMLQNLGISAESLVFEK